LRTEARGQAVNDPSVVLIEFPRDKGPTACLPGELCARRGATKSVIALKKRRGNIRDPFRVNPDHAHGIVLPAIKYLPDLPIMPARRARSRIIARIAPGAFFEKVESKLSADPLHRPDTNAVDGGKPAQRPSCFPSARRTRQGRQARLICCWSLFRECQKIHEDEFWEH